MMLSRVLKDNCQENQNNFLYSLAIIFSCVPYFPLSASQNAL